MTMKPMQNTMDNAGGAPYRRRGRPVAGAAALLAMAAVGHAMFGRVLGEFHPLLGQILPTVVFVLGVCLVLPHHAMPGLCLAAMYATEAAMLALRSRPFGESIVRSIGEGRLFLLAVPLAAAAVGHLLVAVRKRRRLRGAMGKTNLRILLRRPMALVRAYRWSLLVLLVGATLDTVTTMNFMYRDGTAGELHPAMRMMAEELGVAMGVPFATLVRLAFVVFVAAFWRRWCRAVLIISGVLYALAAASNHFHWLDAAAMLVS